jgi:hypothetical protein
MELSQDKIINPLFLGSDPELQAPQHLTIWAEYVHMPVPNLMGLDFF